MLAISSTWCPGIAKSVFIKEFIIHAGDELFLGVEFADGKMGSITIDNDTTDQHFSLLLTAPANSVLPSQNAEWIVEECKWNGKERTPPPDIGSLEFTEVTATTSNGRYLTPADGKLVDWAPKLPGSIGPGRAG